MFFIVVILVIIILAASSVPSALMSIIPGGGRRFEAFPTGILSSLLVGFALFTIIYWIVPNKKMSFRVTSCGALVAACTFEMFIILLSLYVRRFLGNYTGNNERSEICFGRNELYCPFFKNKVVLLLFIFCPCFISQQWLFWLHKSMPSVLKIINHLLMDSEHASVQCMNNTVLVLRRKN